jgi:hypothetical protein
MRVAAEIDAARNSAGSAPLPPSSVSAVRLELPPPPGLELDPIPVVALADDDAAPAAEQVAAVGCEAVDPPLEDGEQGVALNVVGPLAAGGAAAVNPAAVGFAQPAFGQPAQPAVVAQEEFVEGASTRGMIIHLHAMDVIANGQIPAVDMDAAAVALHQRVAFRQHRNSILGPVPTGCCKLSLKGET